MAGMASIQHKTVVGRVFADSNKQSTCRDTGQHIKYSGESASGVVLHTVFDWVGRWLLHATPIADEQQCVLTSLYITF